MPSPEHAVDLERVLLRAAEECKSKRGVWFGSGLPQALRAAMEAHGKTVAHERPEVAFVEVGAVSPQGRAVIGHSPPPAGCPVIGLSTSTLDELGTLLRQQNETGVQITRLICPVAVFDFSPDGLRVREIRHGLTAVDLQRKLPTRLWSGPDLKELGTH